MKAQAVILKAISGQLQWWQAAEILGLSCRTMRRWKHRYQQYGYDGLFDRRRRRPSPRKVPLATVQKVLRLYREQYAGYNVAHFRDQLRQHHDIPLIYPLSMGQDRPANRRAGRASCPTRPSSSAPTTPTVARDDVVRGRQPTATSATCFCRGIGGIGPKRRRSRATPLSVQRIWIGTPFSVPNTNTRWRQTTR